MSIKYFLRKCFFLAIALLLCTCIAEAARFVDNNDGTVIDIVTGLEWQQTNDVDYQQWIQAKEYCEGLQSGGHNDWRLPDKDKLFGIFDKTYYGQSGVAIAPVFNLINHNPNPNSGHYYAFWTDTEYPSSKFQNFQPKYIVIFGMSREDFLGINVDIVSDGHKNDVLCVRDGTLQVENPDIHRSETTEIVQAIARLNTNDEAYTAFTTYETSRQPPVMVQQPNQRPTAAFTAIKNSGQKPATVTLDASGSFDPDGRISSYSWSSSAGRKATGRSASMTFDKAGTYNVILTVKDDKGATDTDETSITIMHDVTPTSVTIQFPPSGAKLTGNVLLAAEVEDEFSIKSVSVFVDGNVFGNMVRSDIGTWEFGLNTSIFPNGPHQLLVKSISNIGLIGEDYLEFISDNEVIPAAITSPGNNDTPEGTVKVDRRPTAPFTASLVSGTASLEVMRDASGPFDPDSRTSSYSWPSSAGSKGASMTFDKAGTYLLAVDVEDESSIKSLTEGIYGGEITPPGTMAEGERVGPVKTELLFPGKKAKSGLSGPSKSKPGDKAEFDFDSPPETGIILTPELSFGVSVELEYKLEKDRDLETRDRDDTDFLESVLDLALTYTPTERIRAFVNIGTSWLNIEDERHDEDSEIKLALEQAFVSYNMLKGLNLKIGRQRIKDKREWVYDENLDAIRLTYEFSNVAFDLSVSEKNHKDLIGRHGKNERVYNYVLFGKYTPFKKTKIGAYVFIRDGYEKKKQENPIFYGLQLRGEVLDNLDYWLEFAHVRGRSEGEFIEIRGRRESNKIRGFGFDSGFTYEFDVPLKPSIVLGYAFGSGDDNPSDRVDRNFRQTGLQDNNTKLNGISKLRYYGEMFDPELSNLAIATGGFGIRPMKKASIEFVYHYYRQHKRFGEIRDDDIREDPDGLNKILGQEVDMVAAYKSKKHIKTSLTVGYFMPGQAFSREADNSFIAEFDIQFEF